MHVCIRKWNEYGYGAAFFRRTHSLFLLIDKISLEEEDTFNYNGHSLSVEEIWDDFCFFFYSRAKWIDKKHKLIRCDWVGSVDGQTRNMPNPKLR